MLPAAAVAISDDEIRRRFAPVLIKTEEKPMSRPDATRPAAAALALLLFAAAAAGAEDTAHAVTLTLTPSRPYADLAIELGAEVTELGEGTLGTVTLAAGAPRYTPSPAFWSLGMDSFRVRTARLQDAQTIEVLVAAADRMDTLWSGGFEGPGLPAGLTVSDPARIAPAAAGDLGGVGAVDGSSVLWIAPGAGDAWITVQPAVDAPVGGQQGSSVTTSIEPPWPPHSGITVGPEDPWTVLAVGGETPDDAFLIVRMRLRADQAGYELEAARVDQAVTAGLGYTPLMPGPHRIELDWWPSGADGDGGFHLRLDGLLVERQTFATTAGWPPEPRVHLGLMATPPAAVLALAIDAMAIASSAWHARGTLQRRLHFHDGLPADLYLGGPAQLAITEPCVDHSAGLQISATGGEAVYLRDSPAQALDELTVRLRLDASALPLADGERLMLLGASTAANYAGGDKHLQLWLKQHSGRAKVYLSAHQDGLPNVVTPLVALGGRPATLDLQWQRALGPGAATGSARLWLDGALTAEATLANHGKTAAAYRFGVTNLSAGAAGRVCFDDLVVTTRTVP